MKKQLLTVRMDDDKYWEFQAAAKARGLPMSALVTQFAFQIIRETKRDMPHEFEQQLAELLTENNAATIKTAPTRKTPAKPFIPRTISGVTIAKKGGRK